MLQDDKQLGRPPFFRFGLLTLLVLVAFVAFWLAMWRAVGLEVIFVTACVPFGLLVYGLACLGARYGHPILSGVLTGLACGILGSLVVYGRDGDTWDVDDFAHLTTTGLAVGLACGSVAWLKCRRAAATRRKDGT